VNRVYRLIKNRVSGVVQVAPEIARAHGKGKGMVKAGTLAAVLAFASPMAWAVNTYWNAGTDNWFTTGNWDTNAVPTIADSAYIDNGGTAQVQTAGVVAEYLGIGFFDTGNLEISSGGTLSISTWSHLGVQAGSSGTVIVDGAGSTWSNSFGVTVGSSGTGTLTISNGGSVSSNLHFVIGELPSGTGTATVTGSGSSLTAGTSIYVGVYGTGTLTLSSGGVVSNTDGVLGNSAGSSGTVTVDGIGSIWSNSGNLTVGNAGTGVLTLSSGGVVSNTDGVLGNSDGSSGTVTVDGIGSSWNNSGNLTVGNAGTGALTLSSGGAVSNTDSYLGYSASGTVTVDGAGSTWTNTGNLYLGYLNTGALNISNGGVVNSSVGWLAVATGTSGTATVDGAGSTWTNSSNLLVGDNGTGKLTITNGGTVSNTNGTIGSSFASGSNGTVTVDGAGSSWTNSATLQVGSLGSGTLTISGGGVVNATGTVTLASLGASSGTLNIGNGAAAGILNATAVNGGSGTGTATLNFNHTSNPYYFTSDGTSGGTAVNITGSTAVNHNGSGTTTLTGANTYTGGTTVNAGTLRRSVAGAFVSNTAYTVNGGTLDLNNLGLTMSSLSGTGGTVNIGTATLTVNQSGDTSYAGAIGGTTGTLIKLGAGTLTLTGASATDYTRVNGGTLGITGGGALSNVNGYLGYDAADSGTVTVDGPGSSWINSAGLFVGYQGSGTLNITNGGTVSNTNGNIGYFGGSSTVTVDGAGSTWTSSNPLQVGYFGSGTLNITNGGVVTVDPGTVTLADGIGSSGTLNIGDGGVAGILNATTVNGGSGTATLNFNHTDSAYYFTDDGTSAGTAINITGSTAVNQTGSGTTILTGVNTYTGATSVDAGTLWVNGSIVAESTVNSGGTLGGTGAVGNVTVGSGGTLAAGNSIGNLASGNIVANSGAVLQFEVDAAGNSDTLNVTGSVMIDSGAEMDVIALGSLDGMAIQTQHVLIDNDGVDAIIYSPASGVLSSDGHFFSLFSAAGGDGNDLVADTFRTSVTLANGADNSETVLFPDAFPGFTFNVAGSDSATFSGTFGESSTPVSLTKAGTGTLLITDTNTYSAGTTISAGTLQIGDGGTTGSIVGNITNNAALVFNRSDDQVFGGDISGSGAMTKLGAGTLTLTGASTHSGGTTISAGTLQIGTGGTSGSLVGNVTNNAALVFNRSDNLSFGGDISGSGTMTKLGAGTLTFSGAGTYSGGTTISAGTLLVNGSLVGDTFVNSGGTLGGSGSLGNVIVNSGGTLSPGNSPGLLTITGDLNLNSGSTTVMEIDGYTLGAEYDHIDVTGTATLDGTLDLRFSVAPTAGVTYNLISAGDIVLAGDPDTGFNPVIDNLVSNLGVALKVTPVISATEYDILIEQLSFIEAAGGPLTRNQESVAANLDSFSSSGQGDTLFSALNMLAAEQLPDALDSLSGVQHSHTLPQVARNTRQFMGILGDRMNVAESAANTSASRFAGIQLAYNGDDLASLFDAAAKAKSENFWARAMGGFGDIDGDANAAAADHNSSGVALGYEREEQDGLLTGVAFGYTRSNIDMSAGGTDIDSYQLAAYGRKQWDDTYLDATLGIGQHRADSARLVQFPGFTAVAQADYRITDVGLSLEAGRQYALSDNHRVTPFAGLQYGHYRQSGFTESGAGDANLTSGGDSMDSLRSVLGARMNSVLRSSSGMQFDTTVGLSWAHEFLNREASLNPAFAVNGNVPFSVNGPVTDRDHALATLGVSASLSKSTQLDLDYRGEFAESDRQHAIAATFRMKW
jgi:T5SS/PEP-CTERM-associated repeat protein/autotransporter-associated beta strand protein